MIYPIEPSFIGTNPNLPEWLTVNQIQNGVRRIGGVKIPIDQINQFLEDCKKRNYVKGRKPELVKQAKAEWKITDEGKRFFNVREQLLKDEAWFYR